MNKVILVSLMCLGLCSCSLPSSKVYILKNEIPTKISYNDDLFRVDIEFLDGSTFKDCLNRSGFPITNKKVFLYFIPNAISKIQVDTMDWSVYPKFKVEKLPEDFNYEKN